MSHATFDFRFFLKCVNMADINGLYKIFIPFFKVR